MTGQLLSLDLLAGDHGSLLWRGLLITLLLTLISWSIAFAVGALLASVRALPSRACDRLVAL